MANSVLRGRGGVARCARLKNKLKLLRLPGNPNRSSPYPTVPASGRRRQVRHAAQWAHKNMLEIGLPCDENKRNGGKKVENKKIARVRT